jgi:hypothetical protein
MDFRVTHFLVADSVSSASGLATVADKTLSAFTADGTSKSLSSLSSGTAGTPGITGPYQLVQGLDRTDAIQKELGVIKSGIIDSSKIVSVRKIVGTDDYSRSVRFFGAQLKGTNITASAWPTSSNTASAEVGQLWVTLAGNIYYVVEAGTLRGPGTAAVPTDTTGNLFVENSTTLKYVGNTSIGTLNLGAYTIATPSGSSSSMAGTLEFVSDKEYTFSVRVRSAKANSISPFGITRGYSATASNTMVNPSNGATVIGKAATTTFSSADIVSSFSALFNIAKNYSDDKMLEEFVRVNGILQCASDSSTTITKTFVFCYKDLYDLSGSTLTLNTTGIAEDNATVGIPNQPFFMGVSAGDTVYIDVRKFSTWQEAYVAANTASAITTTLSCGIGFTANIMVEALEQTTWKNNYDITAFPYKWDYVRLNGYFLEGPYGQAMSFITNGVTNTVLPINGGVSTQTPITYDETVSGGVTAASIAINLSANGNSSALALAGSGLLSATDVHVTAIKFPNLMKEEVRHIAHQYQSYSSKYKQQFKGVRYNAMVLDPQQEKITANGPYTLYYIEYLPSVDTSYTSTQQMTNLTIIATANSTVATQLDYALYGATFASSTDGKYVLETTS